MIAFQTNLVQVWVVPQRYLCTFGADVANYACNASNIAGYEYKNVIVNILTIGAMIKVILASDWSRQIM